MTILYTIQWTINSLNRSLKVCKLKIKGTNKVRLIESGVLIEMYERTRISYFAQGKKRFGFETSWIRTYAVIILSVRGRSFSSQTKHFDFSSPSPQATVSPLSTTCNSNKLSYETTPSPNSTRNATVDCPSTTSDEREKCRWKQFGRSCNNQIDPNPAWNSWVLLSRTRRWPVGRVRLRDIVLHPLFIGIWKNSTIYYHMLSTNTASCNL